MRRWIATALLIVVVAACGTTSVRTERADSIGDRAPVPTTEAPTGTEPADDRADEADEPPVEAGDPTTTVPDPESSGPTSTSPAEQEPTTTAVAGEPREPALGVGDPLYPETGSADVDVVSYDVRLAIDPAAGRLDGEVAVLATVPPDITSLPLDSLELDIERVTVDGAAAAFETTPTELLIDLPDERGTSVEAIVEYSVVPESRVSAGIPGGWIATGTESYVLNEPDNARTWLPANDHPSDKATWRFELTTADGSPAIANGDLVQRGGEGEPWVWEQTRPMTTYLVQVIVGDYDIIEAESIDSIDGESIPIIHVVPAGEAERFTDAFDTVADRMAYFEEWVGPYPLDRYGLAFVNDLRGLAMETQGRSMFGADDFAGDSSDYFEELLLAHELAHQWFGNAVSPADWTELWLNESFASYLEWMWLDEIGLQPLDEVADAVLAQRQVPSGSTGEPSSESDLFGFNRYAGGAAVVHALRLTMGDDAFFDLLSRWVAENNGTSQSTEEFIALAEAIHGADLTAFFDAWLYAPSLPPTYPEP